MVRLRRGVFAALLVASTWSAAAEAQQAPAQPAAGAAVPALALPEPPASQLAAARDVVVSSGMSRSFGPTVPQLESQILPMLTRTRPEMTKDLGETLKELTPEFDKKIDDMVDIAAHIYARHMSEDELKATAAFFNSPVGKKYVEAQPVMLDEVVVAMQSWWQQISNYMMSRVRQEMIKKGHQF
jgi:hypothetical protein